MIELSVINDENVLPSSAASPTVIKIIGCGGGGSNAVNRMISAGVKDVEFIVLNTDLQALGRSRAEKRLAIGQKLTGGLGAGGNPEIGENAAKEDCEMIKDIVNGADMVIVTAGMGGGTGTGSAPVVAGIAHEAGALTIAVVTTPFDFEGKVRMRHAQEGISKLRENVDSLIVIPNQQIMKVVEKNLNYLQAFRIADDVLCQGVQGISEIITRPGEVNLDFADVENVMKNQGDSILGVGFGEGENRAVEAAQKAISNPMLENRQIDGASKILINITSSDGLGMHEVEDIVNNIKASAAKDVEILFGLVLDPNLGDKIAVTVIATGFDKADNGSIFSDDDDDSSSKDDVMGFADFQRVLHGGAPHKAEEKDTDAAPEVRKFSSVPVSMDFPGEDSVSDDSAGDAGGEARSSERVPRTGVHDIPPGTKIRSDDLDMPACWRRMDGLPRGIDLSK